MTYSLVAALTGRDEVAVARVPDRAATPRLTPHNSLSRHRAPLLLAAKSALVRKATTFTNSRSQTVYSLLPARTALEGAQTLAASVSCSGDATNMKKIRPPNSTSNCTT